MNVAGKTQHSSSFFSSGSLWGGFAGLLLGVGVAVGIQAGFILFPLIILGSAALGVAFGNAVGSILSGDKNYAPTTSSRNFSGGDLEQSNELIDHLRLRENEHKSQIEKETSELSRSRVKNRLSPSLQSAAAPVTNHFQNMVEKQPAGHIIR
jgi:hypothetical protein